MGEGAFTILVDKVHFDVNLRTLAASNILNFLSDQKLLESVVENNNFMQDVQ